MNPSVLKRVPPVVPLLKIRLLHPVLSLPFPPPPFFSYLSSASNPPHPLLFFGSSLPPSPEVMDAVNVTSLNAKGLNAGIQCATTHGFTHICDLLTLKLLAILGWHPFASVLTVAFATLFYDITLAGMQCLH